MIESTIEIGMPDGLMDAFVTYPEEGGPFPGVVVFMDIWGLREELFDVARRIATVGYYCIVPNGYYRQGRVRFDCRNDKGQMISIDLLPQTVQDNVREQMLRLTDEMVVDDAGRIADFLTSQPVAQGALGTVGYCMGGRHALCVAGAHPERFQANVSLHGTRLVTDAPTSPHRFADRFRGEIYCGFAEHDSLAPPSTIDALQKALGGRSNVRYQARVHPKTVHGYSLPDRDLFDKQAANRDWEAIFALFRRRLGRA